MPRGPVGVRQRPAPAKINLALHVVGRRDDGFHELDTLAVFADVGDHIEVAPASGLSLDIDGPFAAHAPTDERNLALRAALLLRAEAGVREGGALRLTKNLPAGAGLGGGSADAAAVLLLLNEMWETGLDAAALSALGLRLGADVPMCLAGWSLRARGIGERIAPVELGQPLPLVLVWPGRPVATAAAFAALRRRDNPPLPELREGLASVEEVADHLALCRNDLEAAAAAIEPGVAEALDHLRALPDCRLARMSGSGSACFGLFSTPGEARAAAEALRAACPSTWWVRAAQAR